MTESLNIPERLQKQWMARHLLEPPAPEIVGALIEEIISLEDALDYDRQRLKEFIGQREITTTVMYRLEQNNRALKERIGRLKASIAARSKEETK